MACAWWAPIHLIFHGLLAIIGAQKLRLIKRNHSGGPFGIKKKRSVFPSNELTPWTERAWTDPSFRDTKKRMRPCDEPEWTLAKGPLKTSRCCIGKTELAYQLQAAQQAANQIGHLATRQHASRKLHCRAPHAGRCIFGVALPPLNIHNLDLTGHWVRR